MIKIDHVASRCEHTPGAAERPAVVLDGAGSIGAGLHAHDARAASMAVSPGQDASP